MAWLWPFPRSNLRLHTMHKGRYHHAPARGALESARVLQMRVLEVLFNLPQLTRHISLESKQSTAEHVCVAAACWLSGCSVVSS